MKHIEFPNGMRVSDLKALLEECPPDGEVWILDGPGSDTSSPAKAVWPLNKNSIVIES